MPRRSDTNADNFTIEIFQGAACSEAFQFTNPDESPINITGFTFSLILKHIFDTTFQISTGTAPTALGSFIAITNAAQGRFAFTISDEETINAKIGTGRWAIQVDEGNGYPYILWRDVAIVKEI